MKRIIYLRKNVFEIMELAAAVGDYGQ